MLAKPPPRRCMYTWFAVSGIVCKCRRGVGSIRGTKNKGDDVSILAGDDDGRIFESGRDFEIRERLM